jgi:plastocyanin
MVTFLRSGYVPRCILIEVGQTLQFRGSSSNFADFPLVGGTVGSANNTRATDGPFVNKISSGIYIDITFNRTGVFPYFCETFPDMQGTMTCLFRR